MTYLVNSGLFLNLNCAQLAQPFLDLPILSLSLGYTHFPTGKWPTSERKIQWSSLAWHWGAQSVRGGTCLLSSNHIFQFSLVRNKADILISVCLILVSITQCVLNSGKGEQSLSNSNRTWTIRVDYYFDFWLPREFHARTYKMAFFWTSHKWVFFFVFGFLSSKLW